MNDLPTLSGALAADAQANLARVHALSDPNLSEGFTAENRLKLMELVSTLGQAAVLLQKASQLAEVATDPEPVTEVPIAASIDVAAPTPEPAFVRVIDVVDDDLPDEDQDEFEDAEQSEFEVFTLIPELDMSDDEIVAVQHAFDLLTDTGLHDIAYLINRVYGKDLPLAEEERFRQLLDGYAAIGQLTHDETFYGFSPDDHYDDEPLSQDDVDILDFIHSEAEHGPINIGQIIREHLQYEDPMPPAEKRAFIRDLNHLVSQGYLTHEDGSPWYGRGQRKTFIDPGDNLPHIHSTPLRALEPAEEVTAEAQTMPAAEEEVIIPELGIEGTAVLQIALDGPFRVGELRTQPPFNEYTASEWQSFKARMPQIRDKIADYLTRAGFETVWGEEGKARGKKYELIAEVVTTSAQDQPAEADEDAAARAMQAVMPFRPKAPVERTPDPEQQHRLEVTTMRFAESLVRYLRTQLDKEQTRSLRLSAVSNDVARQLRVEADSARDAVRATVHAGHFYWDGREGSRWLTAEPSEKKAAESKSGKQSPRAWTEYDIQTAPQVLQTLNDSLQHVQQWLSMSDVEEVVGGGEQVRRLARKMHRHGLVQLMERRTTRGRGRSQPMSDLSLRMPDQAFKLRWQEDPASIITEINGLLGQE